MGLRVVLGFATAIPLGLLALVDVIDGNGGEAGHTPFMDAVLDEQPPTFLVFLLLPVLLGVSASWAARRGGLRVAASLVTGPLTVAGYLWLLVVLGTGPPRGRSEIQRPTRAVPAVGAVDHERRRGDVGAASGAVLRPQPAGLLAGESVGVGLGAALSSHAPQASFHPSTSLAGRADGPA